MNVSWLQDALNRLGASLVVDGRTGPKTIAAVRAFQARAGLVVDGIAGQKTIAALVDRGVPPPAVEDAAGPPTPPTKLHVETLPLSFWLAFVQLARDVGVSPYDLAIVISNESGFSHSAKNPGGAVGLNQFEPEFLPGVGWTKGPQAFLALSETEQLPFVKRFYESQDKSFRGGKGLPYTSAEEAYLINFTPAFWSHRNEPGFVIGDSKAPLKSLKRTIYDGNRAFDANGDGLITMSDIPAVIAAIRRRRVTQIAHQRIASVLGETPPGAPGAGSAGDLASLVLPLALFLAFGSPLV